MISMKKAGLALGDVVTKLNKFACLRLAESWDNVGLLVEPSPPFRVTNMLLTNDLTEDVLEEAIDKEVNCILSYHPPIFVPLKKLTNGPVKERIMVKCIENRIAVYSPHTCYDALQGGVNDWLVQAFGENIQGEPISNSVSSTYLSSGRHRVDFTVDKETNLQLQLDFTSTAGIGSFQCFDSVSEAEDDCRLSVVCSDDGLMNILKLLNNYEDSVRQATEIIKLEKPPLPGHGSGRIATLSDEVTVDKAVEMVKNYLKLKHVRVALGAKKEMNSKLKTVAVCAGSGSSVLKGVKADLFLTGEMSHHEVLDAVSKKTTVILCDHSNTERGFLHILKEKLLKLFENEVKVTVSETDKDPLVIV